MLTDHPEQILHNSKFDILLNPLSANFFRNLRMKLRIVKDQSSFFYFFLVGFM